jgi:hypothetical protein
MPASLLCPQNPESVLCVYAADVHIGANPHKELMEEVKAAAVHLEAMREVRAISEAAGGPCGRGRGG